MSETMMAVLSLLKQSLWGEQTSLPSGLDWPAVYRELNSHAVAALVGDALLRACPDPNLRRTWLLEIAEQLCRNEQNLYGQAQLLKLLKEADVPTVILKGSAAARYYPEPEKRTLGDVDFLVPEEAFRDTLALLKENGYVQTVEAPETCSEVFLVKDGVAYELHRGMNLPDWDWAEELNRRLQEALREPPVQRIGPYAFPVLEEEINGLVLLAHIRQHLEAGLGLRQILDWAMYAARTLNDAVWYGSFQSAVRALGMEAFAVTLTRMCQLYLGLPEAERSWCREADDRLCRELLDYIFQSGNFGRKMEGYAQATQNVLASRRAARGLIMNLQRKGRRSELVKKYPVMQPFAWCVQLGHYVRVTARREDAARSLRADLKKARKLRKMMRALGLTE